MNTKSIGTISESKALVFLLESGFSVSVSFGENAPYDFIIESPDGKLFRLQCRTMRYRKGVLEMSLRSVSKNYQRPLDFNRIDAFCGVYRGTCYIVPVHRIVSRSVLSLRVDVAKNNQEKGVLYASDFADTVAALCLTELLPPLKISDGL